MRPSTTNVDVSSALRVVIQNVESSFIRRNTSGFAAGIRCMDRYPKKYSCELSCSLPKISSSSRNGAVFRTFVGLTVLRRNKRRKADRIAAHNLPGGLTIG